jgi:hypothetical protein
MYAIHYYLDDQSKEDEMGGTCNTDGNAVKWHISF